MKKILILAISTILLISCDQTNKEKNHTDCKNKLNAGTIAQTVKLYIEPKVLNLSAFPKNLNIKMVNNTNDTITAGDHYRVEYFENNKWKEIFPKNFPKGIAFYDIGYRLGLGDTISFIKSLFNSEINYKTGNYRIGKDHLKPNYPKTKEKFYVYAEFIVM